MPIITESDNGQTISLPARAQLEIRLPENATAGYRWHVEGIDSSVCTLVADERHGPAKKTPGAPGEHVWRLTATSAGEGSIALAYGRSWQPGSRPTRTFRVRLRVTA